MTPAIVPAAILALVALVGAATFSRLPMRPRLVLDVACFAALSGYFFWRDVFPAFPPLSMPWSIGGVSLRIIGGAWWLFGARVLAVFVWLAVHRDRNAHETRLVSDLAAAAIYVATALVVLNTVFALPVTGVVATSGVVAIVLGLALQNTLADVFAGIAVGIEGPFGLGDRVLLNDKLEGVVVEVNWRSVRIQTDGDDIAIIPNSVVAKADILNRSFPTQRRATSVELSCPEGAMPEKVIETLVEATLLCPDILRTPSPSAFVTELGPKRNRYEIIFHIEAAKGLAGAKSTLLRLARRQLLYAGLLEPDPRQHQPRSGESGKADARRLLSDITLFESLSDERITALAQQLRSRRLEPGETLFKQGDAGKALFVMASGVLEFTRMTAGTAETIGCVGAGEYIGEIGLLTGRAHVTTATACTHCRVYELLREALTPLVNDDLDLADAFDRSARKGLDILHRQVAVRANPEIGEPGQLLAHIRGLFQYRQN